ncbi:hypothetical protein PDJAM_G00127520 [Pangasius djambal]|uniref:Uncharacterized protein n=1 Tax=Pangasius djambal TaxID=1691987 RepID=A0ACC5ZAN1_9TELE|nr:hypothetical protein [Pangasius djambal]
MNNLQTGNTGWYWCAVEIGGPWFPDVNEDLYITVKSDPDLSVMESRVRGEEGGNVTVQCRYSAAYQNTQKQWCRFKDECGNSVGRTATSQNSTVHISDDGRGSFSVQMSGLKKSDAGWYWCSAGDLQVPVHISVHDPPPGVTTTVTTAVTTTTHNVTTYISVSEHNSVAILVIIICMQKKKCKDQIRTRDRSNDTTVHTPTLTDEDSITYSTVAVSKPKVSPNNVDDEAIYSNMVYQ